MVKKIEISHRTIIFTIGLLISLWVLFQIRDILLILYIGLILTSSLNPTIKKLEDRKIPRWVSILLIYIIIVLVMAFGVGGLVPVLADQTNSLIRRIPSLFAQFKLLGIDESVVSSQLSQFTTIPTNIIKFVFNIFSNIVQVFAIAVITFYLLLERRNLDQYLTNLFGAKQKETISQVIDKIETRLGSWVRGQLLLMLSIGFLTYIGFVVIGLEFALPLAILAFLFEALPSIGPVIAAVPAVILSLLISPVHALATAGWAFVIQQIENSFLVPKIMREVTGVNPLISILAIAIGFSIAGIGGAILAIPTYLILEVVFKEMIFQTKN